MSQQVLHRDTAADQLAGIPPDQPAGTPPDQPVPVGDIAGDEVERALLQARALVDAAISNHHRRRSNARTLVELSPDDETARTTLTQMVAATREELICILPAERCHADRLDPALREIGRLAGAGVSVRVLCSPETILTAPGIGFLARAEEYGIQVRVAKSPVQELVMVDERAAMVRSGAGTDGPEALVALAPAILRTLRSLFVGAWDSASPPARCARFGERAQDGMTRQILGFLSAGYKDDTAARALGLSVRTYRRYVADLMRDMGAASRFQAGARAVELGLCSCRSNHRVGHYPASMPA